MISFTSSSFAAACIFSNFIGYMFSRIFTVRLVFLLLLSASCKKDNNTPEPQPEPVPETSSFKIQMRHMAGPETLAYNKYYSNQKGDSISFTRFVYYLSNIVLTAVDGSTYAEQESYHLVDHSVPSSLQLNISSVPLKTYNKISFMIGVDSLRNVSGSQTGDLAPSKGMFWTWLSGYIFLKVEGTSPKAANGLTYHVGGYKGQYRAQRNFTIVLPNAGLSIGSGASPVITLDADILRLFGSPNVIDVSSMNYVTNEGANAKMLADNYANMINFNRISN